MRSFILPLVVIGAVLSAVATPSASNVSVGQSDTGFVTVSYDLSADAIVTLELLAGETRLDTRAVVGDVNRLVSKGSGKRIYWRPDGASASGATLQARISVWTEAVPPDYMSLPLVPSAERRYYASTNDLPHPVTGDYYRTRAILFRRIPAKGVTFRMGSPTDEAGRQGNETQHEVSFGADYYLSVFPVTQGQWRNGIGASRIESVYGGVGSTSRQHRDDPDGRYCPVDNCSSWNIQGVYDGQAKGNLFETDNNTWLQVLKEYTGESLVRLPTEAEWEYACRAETAGATYDDKASLDELAWHAGNSEGRTHPVGLKRPNAWGLYDMLGNVYEICIDDYVEDLGTSPVSDPYAQGRASHKTDRGGSYATAAAHCRSAARTCLCSSDVDRSWGSDSQHPACGFRLYCGVPE